MVPPRGSSTIPARFRFLLTATIAAAAAAASSAAADSPSPPVSLRGRGARSGTETAPSAAAAAIPAARRKLQQEANVSEQQQPPKFAYDLTNMICPDVVGIDRLSAPDAPTCESLCLDDPRCHLWQYCSTDSSGADDGESSFPRSTKSCFRGYGPDEITGQMAELWTEGDWIRCYHGIAASPSGSGSISPMQVPEEEEENAGTNTIPNHGGEGRIESYCYDDPMNPTRTNPNRWIGAAAIDSPAIVPLLRTIDLSNHICDAAANDLQLEPRDRTRAADEAECEASCVGAPDRCVGYQYCPPPGACALSRRDAGGNEVWTSGDWERCFFLVVASSPSSSVGLTSFDVSTSCRPDPYNQWNGKVFVSNGVNQGNEANRPPLLPSIANGQDEQEDDSAVIVNVGETGQPSPERQDQAEEAVNEDGAGSTNATTTADATGTATAAGEDLFTIDLTGTICPGLVPIDRLSAPTEQACAEYCFQDEDCDAWQYCPADVPSCLLTPADEIVSNEGGAVLGEEEWTPGDWTRCYVSTTRVKVSETAAAAAAAAAAAESSPSSNTKTAAATASDASSGGACIPDPRQHWIGRASNQARVGTTTTTTTTTTDNNNDGNTSNNGGMPEIYDVKVPDRTALDVATDLRHAICPHLIPAAPTNTEENNNNNAFVIDSVDACRRYCTEYSSANGDACVLWQYCPPEAGGPCIVNLETNERTSVGGGSDGNVVRCYVATKSSYEEHLQQGTDGPSTTSLCRPDPQMRWLGGMSENLVNQIGETAAASDSKTSKEALSLLAMLVPHRLEPVSAKRGFSGYGDGPVRSCADAQALNVHTSWYYTWTPRTSQYNFCRNTELLWGTGTGPTDETQTETVRMGGEFVPMIINTRISESILENIDEYRADWSRANVHYLLGYNEPDPAPNHPQSVTAEKAAWDWVNVQKIAAAFDPPLTLVSPAPSSKDFDEDGRSAWLDDFFGNCTETVPECDPDRIKVIAFHDYVGDAEALQRRIDGMHERYGRRPLWLTEYSIGRWSPTPTREEQDAYLRATLPVLERHPAVQRYAWFNSRLDERAWDGPKSLLEADIETPTLTSTGEIYATPWSSSDTTTPGGDAQNDVPEFDAVPPSENLGAILNRINDARNNNNVNSDGVSSSSASVGSTNADQQEGQEEQGALTSATTASAAASSMHASASSVLVLGSCFATLLLMIAV